MVSKNWLTDYSRSLAYFGMLARFGIRIVAQIFPEVVNQNFDVDVLRRYEVEDSIIFFITFTLAFCFFHFPPATSTLIRHPYRFYVCVAADSVEAGLSLERSSHGFLDCCVHAEAQVCLNTPWILS